MNETGKNPAHIMWIELETRISTQRLHYRSGDEAAAVKSLFEAFKKTRELLEAYPEEQKFLAVGLKLLEVMRPYLGRWHSWMAEEKFKGEIARRAFRTELLDLQPQLRQFKEAFEELSKAPKSSGGEWPKVEALLKGIKKGTPMTMLLGKVGGELPAGIGEQIAFAKFGNLVGREQINLAEQGFIHKRRKFFDPKYTEGSELYDAVGLALSGGGIRSATVCLGAVQELQKRDLFSKVDYLSTVSGGGYLGAFISSYLGCDPKRAEMTGELAGEKIEEFLKSTFENDAEGKEAAPVRHLRNNSKYLLNGGLWGKMKIAGLMISGLMTNFAIILPLPLLGVLALYVLDCLGYWKKICVANWFGSFAATLAGKQLPFAAVVFLVALLLFGVAWLCLPLVRKVALAKPFDSQVAKRRGRWEVATLGLGLLTIGTAITCGVPAVFHEYTLLAKSLPNDFRGYVSPKTLLPLLGMLPAVLGMGATFFQKAWLRDLMLKLFILSGPLFYVAIVLVVGSELEIGDPHSWADYRLAWILMGLAVLLLLWGSKWVDINTTGPHSYYRNRLCECYLAYRGTSQVTWWRKNIFERWSGKRAVAAGLLKGVEERSQEEAPGVEAKKAPVESKAAGWSALAEVGTRLKLPLADMKIAGAAPYHLINTAVNLPASQNRDLRGRDGDFFLLSPFYSGSPICGYVATSEVEGSDSHMDLGTAMAISGAAASTNMGWRTLPNFRFLMAIFNIRLGYWIPNFRLKDQPKSRGVGAHYFFEEITGHMHENGEYLNISDGGHIENLGVYELLRRKCKFIICVHGGADLTTQGSDLQRLERYAAIDLGISMKYDLDDLAVNEQGYTRAYAVLIEITYSVKDNGEKETGWMIYIKPALTGAEAQYVLDYRLRNHAFPNEGIFDQIFEEEQFECYRAVGRAAMASLFSKELLGDKEKPENVREWFQILAANLIADGPDRVDERMAGMAPLSAAVSSGAVEPPAA